MSLLWLCLWVSELSSCKLFTEITIMLPQMLLSKQVPYQLSTLGAFMLCEFTFFGDCLREKLNKTTHYIAYFLVQYNYSMAQSIYSSVSAFEYEHKTYARNNVKQRQIVPQSNEYFISLWQNVMQSKCPIEDRFWVALLYYLPTYVYRINTSYKEKLI